MKSIFILVLCLVGSLQAGAQSENCGNGIDDDGDGLIDCYDGDCQGVNGCEDFFFNPPPPECGFMPPELEVVELNLLFKTDETQYPIDQRAGVYVGDLNGDGIPDLASRDNSPARIQIFSGDGGGILQSIVTPRTHPFGQMAIADVDADGLGDIFQIEYTGVLARYEFGNPNAVWRTGTNVGDDNVVSTPQIADVNQDGIPEIYVGDRIFDALTGTRYIDGGSNVNVGAYAGGSNADRFPIYYDLFQPGDPKPGGGTFGDEARGMEYIAGNQAWTTRQAGTNNFQFNLAAQYNGPTDNRDGLTSIADINGDGRMDVAVMDGGRVYAWDPYTNQRIGTDFDVPNTGSGGRINIGDFDGDGDVELGFAGRDIYIVRDYSGSGGNNNGTWSTLWQKTGLDDGSQRTGSTLFDFDGNGTVEVVYSEEEDLFIYDGPTGNELFRTTSRSGTRTEYPIVADVNGDGTAEIVVTAQDRNGPQFSGTGWISVYESSNQPWVPARQVWNQHGYNVTNINDDLTVPQFQQDNLNPALGQRYNNFLVQTAIGGGPDGEVIYPAPDAVITAVDDGNGMPVIDFSDCPNTITITLRVVNGGSAVLPGSTPITFYDGDPRIASPNIISTTTISDPVPADELTVEEVTIDISAVPAGASIYLSVNDPGFAQADLPFDDSDFPLTGVPECDYTNNVFLVGNVRCGEVCGNGIDDDGDGLVDEPQVTQFRSTGCPGEVLPALLTNVPSGTFSIVGGSTIGTTVDQDGVLTLGIPPDNQPVTETVRFDDGICFQDVTVTTVDDEAPTVQCPGNASVEVGPSCTATLANFTGSAQASDNCAPSANVVFTQSPAAGSSLDLGANQVTLTGTDPSGNSSTCTFTVTGLDRTSPNIVCPANVVVPVNANCQYQIPDLTTGAAVSDNCTPQGNIVVSQSPSQGQVRSGDGTTVIITLSARDQSNRTANCTYTLTLADETPPTITCPTVGDQTLSNTPNGCSFSLFDYRGQVQRQDNCSNYNQIAISQSPAPGTQITEPGTYTITMTGTDAAGNTSTCSITQQVLDRDPPQLVCPQGLRADPDPVTCELIVPDVIAGSRIIDNCGSGTLTVVQSPAAGTTFTGFFVNVTVTATDASGNSNICVSTVLPGNPPPPSITCPGDQQLIANANCLAVLPDYRSGATTFSCGTTNVQQQPAPGTNISTATTVTLTARDNVGQQVSCTFNVNVLDQTPPTVTCPATQTLAVDGTCEVPLPDYTGQASTQDNCDPRMGEVTLTQSPAANEMYDINDSPVSVTLTAADAAGNTGTCTFAVELMDNQPPQMSCPVSPQTDQLDADCSAIIPDFRTETMVSSTCSMSGFTLTQVPAPGTTVSGEQVVAITITAVDGQGNSISCTFDYETEDVTDPMIVCPANQTEELDGTCSFTIPDYTAMAAATDNCSSTNPAPATAPLLTVTQSPAPGATVTGDGTTTQIILTATDAAGNSVSCNFDLTVEDVTDPMVTCPADQDRFLNGNCAYDLEDLTGLVAVSDNCSAAGDIEIVQMPMPSEIGVIGSSTIDVTMRATDAAGNQSDCMFQVNVSDTTPPAITCPGARTLVVDAACQARVPDLIGDAITSDNCEAVIGGVVVTQDISENTALTGDGTIQVVTLTATDGAGLTAICTVTLTLDDVTPPTVTCPAAQDLNLELTECEVELPDYSGQLVLADNCEPSSSLAVSQMPAVGTVLMGANTVQVVSFLVDDNNGNSASCQFNITLRDVSEPVVNCPAIQTLALNADCAAALPDYTVSVTTTDDCSMTGQITYTQSPAAGSNLDFDGDRRTVTITANDGNGNTSNCSFTVTAEDQSVPMIACPADRDEEVNGDCEFIIPDYTGEAGVMDNCSESAAISVSQSPAIGAVIPQAQLDLPQTITLTATDAAGNSESCTFEITPTDAVPPSIVCPTQQSILVDAANCRATLGDYTTLGLVMDNCSTGGAITVTQNISAGTTYDDLLLPSVDIVLQAEDESGNSNTCSFSVLIRDEIVPTVDCSAASITIELDEDCNGELPDLIPFLVTDDNCNETALTIIQNPALGAQFSGDGTMTTVNFTVTDGSGNSVNCSSIILFEDNSPPNPVICPVGQVLNVDDNCPVDLPDYRDGVTVLDNCRAEEEITLTQTPPPGTDITIATGPFTVTIVADDGNGNTASCDFVVTPVDQQSLDLACPGGQLVIASDDDCSGVLEDYVDDLVAVNQCMVPAGGATFTQTPAAGTRLTIDDLDVPQTVLFEAEDVNGNVSSCTFEVTLVDTLSPTLICPDPLMFEFDASCSYVLDSFSTPEFATITDNCSSLADLLITQDPSPGSVLSGPNATQIVTVTATDPSGNRANCTFELRVTDLTTPNLICPEPDTLLTNSSCEVTIGDYRGQTLADDNCTPKQDLVVEQVPAPGTIISGHLTTETITITATDGSGNASVCTFTVTAKDSIQPMIACPGGQVVRPDANCEALLPDYRSQATVTDNCADAGSITRIQRPAPGTVLSGQEDALEVTIVADDGNGNRDSCRFIVTLEDNVPPTIVCPDNRTQTVDMDCSYELPDLRGLSTVMDNCTPPDDIELAQNVGIGMTFTGDGTMIPVTLTADDGNGNTAQCVTTITLADTTAPTIICPADQIVQTDAECAFGVEDYRDATVDDNCTVPTDILVTQNIAPGTILSGEATMQVVVLTADDGNGNNTSCSFNLELNDVTLPQITCPSDQMVFVGFDCTVGLTNYIPLAASEDNCTATPAITQAPQAGTLLEDLGNQTITLTADDGNGNTNTCTFQLVVADNTAPGLTCPSLSVIPANEDCVVTISDYRDSITVTDNCGPLSMEGGALSLVQSPAEGAEIRDLGTEQIVTITATDPSGNSTTCMITVEVADTTNPTIVCPADTTLAIDSNCAAMIPDYTGLPTVDDDCANQSGADAIMVTQSPVAGTTVSDESSLITITLTATDVAGNSSTCDFDVQLIDTLAPMITCPLDAVVAVDEDCSTTLLDYRPQASATDNCSRSSEITLEQRPAPGTTFTDDGTIVPVTIVAVDQSGNRDSCEFNVTLDDAIDPVILNCPGDSTVFVDTDCSFTTPDFWAASTALATDNCTVTGTTSTTATGEQIVYTQTPAVGAEFTGGMTTETVTLTADDGNGNTTSCSFMLSLSDTISPVITVCPADTVANPDANCDFVLEDYTSRAAATDNCIQDGAIAFTQSPVAGTTVGSQGGVTEITITATDTGGNTSTCSFELTLQDTISPAIVCPAEQVELVDASCAIALPDYTNLATTDDNCTSPGNITVTQNPLPDTDLSGVQIQTITLTADDGNGNTANCSFELSIEDEIDPVLTCPAVSVIPADASCDVMVVSYVDSILVTDNCDAAADILLSQDVVIGQTINGLGATIDVTITAEDQNGNTDQCVISVELVDTISPTIVCPPNADLEVDAACAAVLPDYRSLAVPADNCNDAGGITLVQSPPAGTPLDTEGSTQEVTITATDESGNSISCDFTVTLIDTISPVVVCPADDVISVDGGCEVMIPDYTTSAQPTDNCTDPDDITLVQDPAPGTLISGDGTTQLITITATDASGNTSICTLTVTLEDSTEPLINCPVDQELTADDDCEVPIPDYTGDASVSSSCDQGNGITITQDPAPGTLISGHDNSEEITLLATDASGNSTSCTFTVTLKDRTAPTIAGCPTDVVEQVDASCEVLLRDYWLTSDATATDNCRRTGVSSTTAAANQILYTQSPAPLTVLESGRSSQVVTLTADDTYGNTVSCQFTVTLQDTVAPAITVCPIDIVANPDANCGFTLEGYTDRAVATDNCSQDGSVTFAQSPVPGTVVTEQGTVTEITITATDANGNETTCSFELTLRDTISPSIQCPVTQTETLSAACTDTIQEYTSLAVVADNCTEPTAIAVTQDPAPGTVFTGVQVQEITLTADDGNGNTATCMFELNIVDEMDPELTCPAQSIIPADAACTVDVASYLDSVSVTDNCDVAADILLEQDITVGETISGLGSTIDVTLTAADQSGNTDQCVITVVLVDTIIPVLTCVPDTVLGTDGACNAVLPDYRPVASATDNCNDAASITFTQNPAPGTAYSDEATSFDVTIIATDESGNATSCVFSVQLIDTIAPIVVCPTDQVVEVDGACEMVLQDYRGMATPDDNCSAPGEITLVQVPAPGTVFSGEASIVPVTIIATDQSGNVDSCSFTVELDDVTPPVITTCQNDTIGIVGSACTFTLPDYWNIGPAAAQDNCRPAGTAATTATGDQIVYTQSPAPGTVLQDAFATQTITLTADDGNGNSVSCDFELMLTDTTSPTIACPVDTIANPDAGCDFVLEDYTDRAVISDNCADPDDLVVTQTPVAGTVISSQMTSQEITLEVTDPSGNSSTCSFLLTLQDTSSPSITCPLPKIEELDGSCAFTVPDYTGEAVVADNCTDAAGITVTQTPAPATVIENLNENAVVTITLTADDGNGNTSSCDFAVTLDDVIDPVITCPADTTIFADGNCMADLPDLIAGTTATDNCNPVSITQAPLPSIEYNGDDTEIFVTLTADDGNGNTSQCRVRVTLQDTVSPTIVCPPNEVLLVDANCEVGLPDYRPAATTSDNCTLNGNILVTQDIAPGTVFSGQATSQIITLTADDGNGNTANCTLEITLDDQITPTIVCPSTQTQFADATCNATLDDYTGLGEVADNCTIETAILVEQSPLPEAPFGGMQSITVTLTADDGNGNTATCQFEVQLDDNTAPGIVCPPAQEIDFGSDCQFTLPDYRSLGILDDNCSDDLLTVTQSPSIDSIINDLNTATEVILTVTDGNNNTSRCSFTVTTTSATPPPPFTTVTLAVIGPPTGNGLVDLADALDPAALSNLSNVDLDRGFDAGPGPYLVTYYTSIADADAETNEVPSSGYDPVTSGEAVIARIEDPSTGCFVLSQILLDTRTPGTSGAVDALSCTKPGAIIQINGLPMPGGQGTAIVRHEWRVVDDGGTTIAQDNLIDADQQIVSVPTADAKGGVLVLEYQFFEDYGDGPEVGSVPKRVALEILKVGAGEFFWDGNK